MKRYITAAIASVMLFTYAYADNTSDLLNSYTSDLTAPYIFTDMANTEWAAPSVEFLTGMGIVNGFDDGTFRPESNITKAEFVKIVISAFGLYNPEAAVTLTDNNPSDWYYTYVSSALEKEIATTNENGIFNANEYITREEMFEISKRALDFAEISLTESGNSLSFTDEKDINPDYKASIEYMSAHGIIAGNPDGTLNPKANSTRAEACVMLTRMINSALENEKQIFDNLNTNETEETEIVEVNK